MCGREKEGTYLLLSNTNLSITNIHRETAIYLPTKRDAES
jgi:hypothetical protein